MPEGTYPLSEFSAEDIGRLQPAMKVGILATVNPAGQPHLTLISTLMAGSPSQVVWGQFMEGASKAHVRTNPRTGFLIMTLDRQLWRGKATFTHTATSGKDYDFFNSAPMFRYNAYFGVHTVYYMDLVSHSSRQALPMNRIIFAAVQTMAARLFSRRNDKTRVMNPWTQAFFAKIDNLKFLAYVGSDGYPVIIPVIQAQPIDSGRLVFSLGAYGDELAAIPPQACVAVFGMALTMEDVLVRGVFQGIHRRGGIRCGTVALDWVYNPMPPKPLQIYPEQEIRAVKEF
jgi:hypothetical protein